MKPISLKSFLNLLFSLLLSLGFCCSLSMVSIDKNYFYFLNSNRYVYDSNYSNVILELHPNENIYDKLDFWSTFSNSYSSSDKYYNYSYLFSISNGYSFENEDYSCSDIGFFEGETNYSTSVLKLEYPTKFSDAFLF